VAVLLAIVVTLLYGMLAHWRLTPHSLFHAAAANRTNLPYILHELRSWTPTIVAAFADGRRRSIGVEVTVDDTDPAEVLLSQAGNGAVVYVHVAPTLYLADDAAVAAASRGLAHADLVGPFALLLDPPPPHATFPLATSASCAVSLLRTTLLLLSSLGLHFFVVTFVHYGRRKVRVPVRKIVTATAAAKKREREQVASAESLAGLATVQTVRRSTKTATASSVAAAARQRRRRAAAVADAKSLGLPVVAAAAPGVRTGSGSRLVSRGSTRGSRRPLQPRSTTSRTA
jgi:hypothetical protein